MSIPRPLEPPPVEAPAQAHGRFGGGAGPRLLLLAGVGLAWIIPALWNPTFLWAMLLWDVLLLVAFVGDWQRLPRPRQLTVRREWRSPLSIGVATAVNLAITNQSSVEVWIRTVDELPPSNWYSNKTITLNVPAHATGTGNYEYTPGTRGDLRTGKVFLRCRSGFLMAERWAVADLQQTVRVYPNFEHARKHSVYLARSRQIELQMRMMRMRGIGSDFESLREHQEGDELRNVCWTATARRGKLVSKTFRVERSQAVWIVLDCGRLMRARTDGYSKLDRAVDAALCVAQLALYSGDRVGLLAYGRAVNQRVLPGRGAAQMRHVVEQLALVRDEVPEADHVRAAASLLTLQKQRGMIIWISDLAETAMTPEVIEAAGQMLSRHLLLFVAIAQPELKRLARQSPASAAAMYEVVAAQEMVYRRELLLGRLRERGALCIEVEPSRISASVLNQYLTVKERNLV
ncbi:MAG: DUF58 domain-containing protein [Candidatus Sulfotelmatobacter sp.]